MALRVLLADESTTIKKVIQLSLQDWDVEVKSVNVGVDVLEVTHSFLPHIVLADVLLQKKSGYEVCSELKSNPETAYIPVVLMWSGFMELDQEKFQQSRADGKLEKPFDVSQLRDLVHNLTDIADLNQKDHSSQDRPEQFEEEDLEADKTAIYPAPAGEVSFTESTNSEELPPVPDSDASEQPERWNMDSFEDIEEFMDRMQSSAFNTEEPAKKSETGESEFDDSETVSASPSYESALTSDELKDSAPSEFESQGSETEQASWVRQDIGRFKLDLPEEAEQDEFTVEFQLPEERSPSAEDRFNKTGQREEGTSQGDSPSASPPPIPHILDELDEPEEFQSRPLSSIASSSAEKLDIPKGVSPFESNAHNLLSQEKTNPEVIDIEEVNDEMAPDEFEVDTPPFKSKNIAANLSREEMKEIIRTQTQDLVEKTVRELVPDIASHLIKRELDRLLKEVE